MSDLTAARAQLRARQGAGARYDAANAPAQDLLQARRGTAYLARKIMELSDEDLFKPGAGTHLRAAEIAAISYHARAMTRVLAGGPDWASAEARQAEITWGETLPPRALRALFDHARVHLDVMWRDLSDADWDRRVRLLDGSEIALRDTPAMQARMVWQGAVRLGNGARWADVPPEFRP